MLPAPPSLSIVIPLSPDETSWVDLLDDIFNKNTVAWVFDIIIVLPPEAELIDVTKWEQKQSHNIRYLKSDLSGRAVQMNMGATLSHSEYLWFLHADSRCPTPVFTALLEAVTRYPMHLLYFDLAFLDDGPWGVQLNAWGAYFRSRLLNLPFGDQGFCIKKTLFETLGGFPETVPYGEDHCLVWVARKEGISLHPIGVKLYTSARYYQAGWLKTTVIRQWLWIKQALEQCLSV